MKTNRSASAFRRASCRAGCAAATAAVPLFVLVGSAGGATWNNTAGGSWQTPTNWTPNGIPGANDPAVFGRSAVYGVNLAADAAAASVAIDAGYVMFNFGSFRLTVGGSTTVARSATLEFLGGTLKTRNFDASAGEMYWSNGTINVDGGTFRPSQVTVAAAGDSYPNSFAISGTVNTAARPTLALTGGGTVSMSSTSADNNGSILIGVNGGKGGANVSGGTSALTVSNPAADLSIGHGYATINSTIIPGDGSLTLASGGQAVGGYTIVGTSGGVGRVTIDGVDPASGVASALNSAKHTIVGYGAGANGPGDGVVSLTNGGQIANGDYRVFISYSGGRGVINVGKSDGTDTGGTKLSAIGLELGDLNDYYGARADVTAALNVFRGGTVELSRDLKTYANAANAAATRVNLAGGTVKASELDLQSASHLNWTAGTLWLTGGNSVTNGTLAVPTSGTLKGSGTIGGAVTNLGTVSPGDGSAVAAFTLSAGVTIGAGGTRGTLATDIDFANSSSDNLDVMGAVTLTNARLAFNLVGAGPGAVSPSKTFILIRNDQADAVTGTFATIDPTVSSLYQYTVNYAYTGTALNGTGDGNDVAITFTYVPEPAAGAALIAVTMLARRRRR